MQLSRRTLINGFATTRIEPLALAALVSARGMEDAVAQEGAGVQAMPMPATADEIRINGNENPVGPGAKALQSIVAALNNANRYPFNSRLTDQEFVETLAKTFDASPENFVIGAGSSEILRNAVRIFAAATRHVVTANPSYGSPVTEARKRGIEYRQVPLDDELRLDLGAMAATAPGAGLVYVCNPNNPTGTIHPASAIESFIEDVQNASPDILIVVDEAYHDYVTDPRHHTMIPLATGRRNVIVLRTFSKAYGMAGLRLGYGVGHPDTIEAFNLYKLPANANILAIAAAVASLRDPDHIKNERARNTEVRRYTNDFFTRAGYRTTDSQTNFLFVDLRQPAKKFRDACAAQKIVVARDFPPMEKSHCRISLGTMQEMRRSCEVFADVLGVETDMTGA